MLHLLFQLFLEVLTLCAGQLVLICPLCILLLHARQRGAPGIAMVPKLDLLLHYRHKSKA